MKNYMTPEMDVVLVNVENVIASSTGVETEDPYDNEIGEGGMDW